MTNAQLKSKIEARAGGTIKTSTYKCGGFEGYVTLKVEGNPCMNDSAYGCRTRQQAVKSALISLASRLGFNDLAEQCQDDNQRYNDADFAARTARP